ncbi:MAG: DUF4258 domain-containing protein [Rhabdochlamydiaceae bacterium]
MLTKILRGSNRFIDHKGFELKNPSYQPLKNSLATIQGCAYSAHALDQMQNRGFTPSLLEETIQNGTSMSNKVTGRMQFNNPANHISVITEDGKVVAVIYGRPK